jgi:tRNA C32,U32 (ribose-2'-O)-methylase TrmJ
LSTELEDVLEAAQRLSPVQQRELAAKLLAVESHPSLTEEEIQRNREIVRRTRGTIKGLDRSTIISLAEDEEYGGY